MDDDRPLFVTFKPFGEDSPARAKPAPNTTPSQPQRAEQAPGHRSRHGRVGQGDTRGDTSPAHHPTPSGAASSRAALGAEHPHLSSRCCPLPSRCLQASGHLQQPSPWLRGRPCVPSPGCGLSRHKPRGWGPTGSSPRGSTASSAGGERGGGRGGEQGRCPQPWAPKQGAGALDHAGGEVEGLRVPSRREAEELLQDQPLGCFLVRFSESTVGFVLSYR